MKKALSAFIQLFITIQFFHVNAQSNWQLFLDDVTTTRIRESSGDRPYFNVIYFRSRINQAGSAVVELRSREPNDWVSKREYNLGRIRGDHMNAGENLLIPWWMGQHEWRDIRVVSNTDLAAATRAEIFGAIVVSLDNNNTPPHVVRDILGKGRDILHTLLREQVESGRILGNAISGNFSPLAQRAETLAREAVSGIKIIEYLTQLTVGSTFNPDQVTGIHIFMFPAISGLTPIAQQGSFNLPGGPVTWSMNIATPAAFNRTLAFTGSGAQYSVRARLAEAPCTANPTISSLTIRVRTGEDDLRQNSQAEAFVILRDGRTVNQNLNNGANWPNRSDNRQTLRLPANVRLTDISTFGLRFASGSCLGCTGDNWNVDALSVSAGTTLLLSRQGFPLERFTADSRREWRMNLNLCPPPPPAAPTVSALRIEIRTGGDDLRGGGQAVATIGLSGGRTVTVNLNNGAGWGNNSLNVVSANMPAGTRIEDILTFNMTYNSGGCFGCTYDNWNVDGIMITANTSSGARTLADRRGRPLVRFTEQNRGFNLNLR